MNYRKPAPRKIITEHSRQVRAQRAAAWQSIRPISELAPKNTKIIVHVATVRY